jgi:hypothetical protein
MTDNVKPLGQLFFHNRVNDWVSQLNNAFMSQTILLIKIACRALIITIACAQMKIINATIARFVALRLFR